jgi:hypothetical protein
MDSGVANKIENSFGTGTLVVVRISTIVTNHIRVAIFLMWDLFPFLL